MMRKIKITKQFKKEVEDFNKDLFKKRDARFELPLKGLKDLKSKLKGNRLKKHRKYVDLIISRYSEILNADPSTMKSLIKDFNKILSPTIVSSKYPNSKRYFYKEIVKVLRYDALRDKEFLEYLKRTEIRTCVYCNSQNTLVIEKLYFDKKKRRVIDTQAKLELDHFHSKSKYPFLATSFFNLYPTCGNCNKAKSDKDALFELYTYSNQLDIFKFKIDDKSILNYWMNLDREELQIELKPVFYKDKKVLINHNNLFQVQAIYDKQKDFGEEIVWKAKVNPKIYRETMYRMFNSLFPDKTYIDRAIIGNYTKPEETFKRPMAKYTQDIARQLKLIK
ncbi:hypothetical protein OS188_13785 [Xanthomarina sp. F1114]|uniref:hypothetical protein n=1 Tax=Xanthomarina sp. F1114 TaxID=2996019 RepID=UPI00225E2490|nr:hypothetical protein [Xanthomarina sp. F1114]MCX7549022.1 hypothetical protein [Xanthomarina sp. F1114]